jgi:lathosterol oxidase
MDIVLEVLDTFVLDQAYALLLPARPAPYDYPDHASTNASAQTFSTWQYKPSTDYFQLEPSQYAYMSTWPRDNIFRQGISLFFMTW